jgi:hypothetical protein
VKSLSRVLAKHPEWREPLGRIVHVLRDVPDGGLIDPLLVAKLAQVDRVETLGYLDVLHEAGLGQPVVRVVDNAGDEVERFPSVADIPARVETEFRDEIIVMPENIDISFEPDVDAIRLVAESV